MSLLKVILLFQKQVYKWTNLVNFVMEWVRGIQLEGNDSMEGVFPSNWAEFEGNDKFIRWLNKNVSPSSNWLKFEILRIKVQHRT